jgi:hypothetical protein
MLTFLTVRSPGHEAKAIKVRALNRLALVAALMRRRQRHVAVPPICSAEQGPAANFRQLSRLMRHPTLTVTLTDATCARLAGRR